MNDNNLIEDHFDTAPQDSVRAVVFPRDGLEAIVDTGIRLLQRIEPKTMDEREAHYQLFKLLHDCRHSWATRASRNGTSPFALQEAGGWNSLTMPRRYIDESEIANEGVKLG